MGEQGRRKPLSTLQRFARRASAAAEATQEHCELCGEPIPHEHRHLVEVATREITCVCRACSILFHQEAASGGKYKLVPDRHLYLRDFRMSDPQWESLLIPVGMAYFFYSTPAARVVAYYPSPMGPTESLLRLSTWEDVEASNPMLREMQRDVEALLVNRTHATREHYLVPIDECYSLVALIRLHWRGLSGGQEVWQEIPRFFEVLRERSRTVAEDSQGQNAVATRGGSG